MKSELETLRWKYKGLSDYAKSEEDKRKRAERIVEIAFSDVENVWKWMGDGNDHPENLSCPVVMEAATLRALLDKHSELHRRAQKVEGEAAQLVSVKERNERYIRVILQRCDLIVANWRRRYNEAWETRSLLSRIFTVGFGVEWLRQRLLKAELRAEKAERVVDCYLNTAHCFGEPCNVCRFCVALRDYTGERIT